MNDEIWHSTNPNVIQIPANFFYVYTSIKSDPSSSKESTNNEVRKEPYNQTATRDHMNFLITGYQK